MEWVKVKYENREVICFIAFPEVKEKVAAVVVIHEIFGLTDWVRSVADQLAEAGYIAIAPDLLSGMAPGGRGTAV
jgi:carboxymethylenebutenolidase